MHEQRLFFCYKCGGKLQKTADMPPRLRCVVCGTVSFENPVVGVAGIVLNDVGEILLVQRAERVDYAGLWCIPCGYVEYDEEVRSAVKRELKEETGLDVVVGDVFSVHSNFHNPKQHTVGIWFKCSVSGGVLKAGDDAQELGWFSPDKPPKLAFPTDEKVLGEITGKMSNG